MDYPEIQRIAVLGAGTMGVYIAQFFAFAGYQVSLYSRTQKTLDRAFALFRETPEGVRALERVQAYTEIAPASAGADWVIETVAEDPEIKKQVLEAADRYAPAEAFLTSDTSALNIFQFLETGRPERVMITHFFNPAVVMPLVEMVPGPQTDQEAVACLRAFLEQAGKKPVVLKECIPGFLANRLTVALAREAYYLAGKGYASIEDIDRVITTTFGPRYVFEGIFDLYDYIGLDVGCAVAEDLLPELCRDTGVPALLREKAEAGELGVKTLKGLKDYSGLNANTLRRERTERIAEVFRRLEGLV